MEATKPTVWEFPVMQEHVHSWSEYINQCHSDWFRHKTPSIPRWRESRCVTRPKVAKETTLATVTLTERIIRLPLVASNIKFHVILFRKHTKTVVSPIDPNQRYIAISKKWRHTGQEKRSWPFQYSAIFSVIWNFVCNSASRLTYIKINNSLLFHYNISWIKLLIIKIIK